MSVDFVPIEACAATQPFAECRGIDLSQPLSESDVSTIRQGLLEHGLVLFRDQMDLTPEHEIRFNEAFGWHDPAQSGFLFGGGCFLGRSLFFGRGSATGSQHQG